MSIRYPAKPTHIVSCANNCGAPDFPRDASFRVGVGLSHYQVQSDGSYLRSYVQVFETPHSHSHECAMAVAKARADGLASLPKGTYTPQVHNPSGEFADSTVKGNVEYNTDGILPASQLPKQCAMCGASLVGKDVYIPHIDNNTLGVHYQEILLQHPVFAGSTVPDVTLGADTQEHATQLVHAILNEIIQPHATGQPLVIIGGV